MIIEAGVVVIKVLFGNQPVWGERRKGKNWQPWGLNPVLASIYSSSSYVSKCTCLSVFTQVVCLLDIEHL